MSELLTSDATEVDVEVGFFIGCTCCSLELEEEDELAATVEVTADA